MSEALSTVTDLREAAGVSVDLRSPEEAIALFEQRARPPTFPELVYAHFIWWKTLRGRTGADDVNKAYHHVVDRFERHHGPIIDSYWCSHVESGVVLTQKKGKLPWGRDITFHRATDWATKRYPDIAAELHRCDELAIRAKTILRGVRQRICLQLVMTSASHLLSLADARVARTDDSKTAASLDQERALLARTDAYYQQAANGQAQIVYFAGMVVIAAVVACIAGYLLTSDWVSPIAAVIAGSIGAVVSVIQRINAGNFDLSYDVGRPYAFFLGGLRPLIGAAFAVTVSFLFTSGMLHLPLPDNATDVQRRLALMVIAFLAGFSERWAQDTLATALPGTEAQSTPEAASAPPAPSQTPSASPGVPPT
ncbi:MAG: hypothetical protein QOD46_5 [Actinomycetota bacterium]|jgi:hypothetical protein|nr:hypothetical protein [Actinomycetota bacterium]